MTIRLTILLALTGCHQMLSQDAVDAVVTVHHQHTDVHGTWPTRGTGWIFAKTETSTYILTNNHVVDPAPSAWTKIDTDGAMPAGTRLEVLAVDRNADLAVLRADVTTGVEPIPLCGGEPDIAERVMIIGYRGAEGEDFTVATGNVMWIMDDIRIATASRTYKGMSGSPVLNATGECAYSSHCRGKHDTYIEPEQAIAATNEQTYRLIDAYL